MKALITGGGGFLGSRIAEMLRERGDQVKVFGRSAYPRLKKMGVECLVGDVRDSQSLNRAFNDVEVVFHTAAKPGIWGRREDFFAVNSRGTANVIQACLLNHVEKLVYTSTPSVVFNGQDIIDGDETLPHADRFLASYPASKSMAERMVLDANGWEFVIEKTNPEQSDIIQRHASTVRQLATCALRPHLIWGPGDPHLVPRLLQQARTGKLRCVGDGANMVSLTYIDHAARAHIQAAEHLTPDSAVGGQVYFINDREPVQLWEWINHMLTNLNLQPVKKKISFPLAYTLGGGLEFLYTLVPRLGEPPLTRFVAEQLAKSHSFSIAKARQDFHYQPDVEPETGFKKMIEYFTS